MRRSIALFGGSFNPPHLGHLLCAVYAKAMAGVDAVWVLPVADHPYGKRLAPWALRWRLCEAAFADLDFVQLRDDELRNPGGRTITLLAGLRQRHPEVDWQLIGGSDTERDIRNWYRGTELLRQVRIIPVPRRGYDDEHPAALPAISSTGIRERLAAGEAVDGLVPRSVAAILATEPWYRAAGEAAEEA